MFSQSPSSQTDDAYQRLRADILNGRIAPGSRLRVKSLSDHYGFTSGVIREALPRLVGQGLAVSVPQHGVRVISVDAEDLAQLTDAAVEIESLVLRRSLAEGDVEWEAQVVASHHQLSRVALHDEDGAISQKWVTAHARFHLTILDGCSNRRLTGLAAQLRDAGEVYRHWSDRAATDHITQEQHVDNHRIICELVVARDAEAAVAALREHITLTTDLMSQATASAKDSLHD